MITSTPSMDAFRARNYPELGLTPAAIAARREHRLGFRSTFRPGAVFGMMRRARPTASGAVLGAWDVDDAPGLGKSWLAKRLKVTTKTLAKIKPSKGIIAAVAMVPGVGTAAAGVLTGARVVLGTAQTVMSSAEGAKMIAQKKIEEARSAAEKMAAEQDLKLAQAKLDAAATQAAAAKAKINETVAQLPPAAQATVVNTLKGAIPVETVQVPAAPAASEPISKGAEPTSFTTSKAAKKSAKANEPVVEAGFAQYGKYLLAGAAALVLISILTRPRS